MTKRSGFNDHAVDAYQANDGDIYLAVTGGYQKKVYTDLTNLSTNESVFFLISQEDSYYNKAARLYEADGFLHLVTTERNYINIHRINNGSASRVKHLYLRNCKNAVTS